MSTRPMSKLTDEQLLTFVNEGLTAALDGPDLFRSADLDRYREKVSYGLEAHAELAARRKD